MRTARRAAVSPVPHAPVTWRSLGAADIDGFLDPVGIVAGRWLFAPSPSPDRPTTSAAVLDLTSGQWTRTAQPAIAASGYLSAGAGDRVLAMAAQWAVETSPPAAVSWDPATDTWAELSPPPLAHRVGAAVAWTGNELVVWGGASTSGFGGTKPRGWRRLPRVTDRLLARPAPGVPGRVSSALLPSFADSAESKHPD